MGPTRLAKTAAIISAFALVSVMNMPTASAGGTEVATPGTQALGRGGAAAARTDNPMSLYYNPAALAFMPGIQLSLQTHLAFMSACFDRAGSYGDNVSFGFGENAFRFSEDDGTEFAEVCNSGPPGVIPELVFTWRVHRQVGIALGFVAPSAIGHTIWGDDVQIGDRTYRGVTTANGRTLPSASRYMLVEEDLIIAFPTLGIGYAPHPRISLGLAFGSGIGIFNFTTISRVDSGEELSGDVLSELSAADYFVPRITASVHARPIDGLDLSFSFIWTDTVQAEGDLSLQTGYYRTDIVDQATISGVQLEAPMPMQFLLGIRFADRISPINDDPNLSRLSGRIEDSMSNERWDIELNLMYHYNSGVEIFNTTLPNCVSDGSVTSTGQPRCDADGNWSLAIDQFATATLPGTIPLRHNWSDQLSVRLGGDYNIVPGFLTARAGLSYETQGVEAGFEQLDFLPFQRFGVHLGGTIRFANFDISLAYAHVFQFEVIVEQDTAQVRQTTATYRLAELACEADPDCSTPPGPALPGKVQNIGTFTSGYDFLSLGLTYHFR